MKRYYIIMIVFIFSLAYSGSKIPVKILLINDNYLDGKLVQIIGTKYYLEIGDSCYVVGSNIIKSILYKDRKLSMDRLKNFSFDNFINNNKIVNYKIKTSLSPGVEIDDKYAHSVRAGNDLKTSGTLTYVGCALVLFGSILSASNKNGKINPIGLSLIIAGGGFLLASPAYIIKAGDEINNYMMLNSASKIDTLEVDR